MRIRAIILVIIVALLSFVASQEVEDEEPEIHHVLDENVDGLFEDVLPKNWPWNLHLPEIRNVEQFK